MPPLLMASSRFQLSSKPYPSRATKARPFQRTAVPNVARNESSSSGPTAAGGVFEVGAGTGGEGIASMIAGVRGLCHRHRGANWRSLNRARLCGVVVKRGDRCGRGRAPGVRHSDIIPLEFGRLAQLARASPLHGEGRWFESSIAHVLTTNPAIPAGFVRFVRSPHSITRITSGHSHPAPSASRRGQALRGRPGRGGGVSAASPGLLRHKPPNGLNPLAIQSPVSELRMR